MSDDEAAVRDALVELDAAFQRGDITAVLDLCTDDVVFVGSGEDEEGAGRDATAAMFDAIAARSADAELTIVWDSVDVDLKGDVALLVAWGNATLQTPRRAATTRYRLTGVLLCSGGRWRWRVYHGSEPAAW